MPGGSSASTSATGVSAPNALFLIGFGMFLTIAVMPALVAALLRTLAILIILFVVAAMTNPNDQSFAYWISAQENVRTKENSSVTQWMSAVVKTAMALMRNEPVTWTFHNVILFSVVFVPALERYAFGCFGMWRWADTNKHLMAICKAPLVAKISRGGVISNIERYTNQQEQVVGTPLSVGNRSGDLRRRRAAQAPMSASLEGLMDAIGGNFVSSQSTVTMSSTAGPSDRELRIKAMNFKVKKEWKEASKYFLEAALAAMSALSRTNYQLEAAWCMVEDSDDYGDMKRRIINLVQNACEELSSSGYFDEAASGIAELAQRLNRKFARDSQQQEFAKEIALLYVQAKNIAEAGGNMGSTVNHGLRAASVYTNARLWSLAEECFETAGMIQLYDLSSPDLAMESLGNAVLCRIGEGDMIGATQLKDKSDSHVDEKLRRANDMDVFITSVLKAHDKWSLQILETACKRYDSVKRLAPWQWQCLSGLQEKLSESDLR